MKPESAQAVLGLWPVGAFTFFNDRNKNQRFLCNNCMYNHLLNTNNELDIKMLRSGENKQKNTDGQFRFLLLFVCF